MSDKTNWLQRLAWTTLGWNVLVILWGAVVRATQSGAGCGNNWPLCNGEVIPVSPRVDTIIEFTHRCMTGGAAVLVLALLIGVLVGTEKNHRARIAAWVAMLLLVNEAFLGYLLVTLGYVTTNRSFGRVVVLSIHLSNTLLLLAALTVTAALLGRESAQGAGRPRVTANLKTRVWVAAGLAATMVVGVSGSLAALGDTLFPSATLAQAFAQDFAAAAPLLLRLRWVHPAAACVAAVFVVWLVLKAQGRLRWLVAALLGVQFLLGVADVLLLAPVWMQILHLLGADLYWIALVLLSLSLLGRTSAPVSASNSV